MNIVDINTINSIKADVTSGKRTLKAISSECRIFEKQANNDEAKAIYARLSDCKTRKEFNSVFDNI